jgi:hypothetical protein
LEWHDECDGVILSRNREVNGNFRSSEDLALEPTVNARTVEEVSDSRRYRPADTETGQCSMYSFFVFVFVFLKECVLKGTGVTGDWRLETGDSRQLTAIACLHKPK